jgi:hypothetical protein
MIKANMPGTLYMVATPIGNLEERMHMLGGIRLISPQLLQESGMGRHCSDCRPVR